MTRLLKIAPAIILSAYITTGNLWAFRPALMRPLSLAGLLLMGAALWGKGRREGSSAIDKGFLIYMGCSAFIFWALSDQWIGIAMHFTAGLLYAILFIVVALPAAATGTYFTEFFAKKRTPEIFWDTPLFKAINRNMTWVWAAIFALSAGLTLVPVLVIGKPGQIMGILFQVVIPMVLVAGVGAPFNKRYPAYYKRKAGIAPLPGDHGAGTERLGGSVPATRAPRGEEEMTEGLKVVAINGSPHRAIGNTGQMIGMVAAALAEEGVGLEEVFLCDKTIGYCVGCAVCLEGSRCWQKDDHGAIVDTLLAADGIILASPVYFKHVTAQMKTFVDRSLSFGHKPRTTWKPGLAIAVSAGLAGTETARYLEQVLRVYGAYSVGALSPVAVSPGQFLGVDAVRDRARDLARDLVRAVREKKRRPASDEDLGFYLFMRDLVTREKDLMRGDYRHWQDNGFLEGFEAYLGQQFARTAFDPAMRAAWVREMIGRAGPSPADDGPSPMGACPTGTCRELLQAMPLGFKAHAAQGLSAVYQFEMSGSEEFTAHLTIEGNLCTYHDGPHARPAVVIRSPAEVWLAISRGELDGQAAFMSGRYKVEGDLSLLLKLRSLFGR